MKGVRGYVFTINNYTDDDLVDVICVEDSPGFRYICCGFEVGDQGTPHLQGYVYFDTQKPYEYLSELLPRARIEVQKADDYAKAYGYCMKDGEYYEVGNPPRGFVTNKRVNVSNEIMTMIANGDNLDAIKQKYPGYYMIHHEKIQQQYNESRKFATKFYYHIRIADGLSEVYELLDLSQDNVAFVTDLIQLELYPGYTTVIYAPEYNGLGNDHQIQYWPRGLPISYKLGYMLKRVVCDKFIIIYNNKPMYNIGYVKI